MITKMWFGLACVCAVAGVAGAADLRAPGQVAGRVTGVTVAVAKEAAALSEYDGSTAEGDYAISSAATLRLLAEKSSSTTFAGSTFTLTANIDLADAVWMPINTFSGTFDGDGHTISNLVVNLPTTEDVGLFKILKNATIKKLSIRGGKVEGLNRAAGIAGRVSGGTVFEDCTTDLEVIAHGYDAGGLVAWVDGTGNNCFSRCRTLGPVTAYADVDRAGGLVAVTDSSFTIDSCYASGAVTGYGTTGHVGGLLGRRYGGTVTVKNSYSVSRLQGNYMTQATESTDDDIVGTGLVSVTVESRPTLLDCFPKNKINLATRGNDSGTVTWDEATGQPVATADEGSVFIRWDGEIPSEGDYNERTLYAVFGKAIATEADLRAVAAKGFFKQTGDIEMTSGASFNGLHASPRFQGEYDGAGYAIKNLKVTAAGENTGLFRVTQGAILKDIHLVGGEVSGGKHVGALVGWQFGGLVERCSASAVVRATAVHAAGLIGRASYRATIRECCASGPVISKADYVGGLISYTYDNVLIEDCYARGDVWGTEYVGGFIGGADYALTIKNCYSSGKVNCSVKSGGFFARNDGSKTVTGCFWDSTKAGQTSSTYGTALATATMFGSSAYTGWDETVWNFTENGYPTLKRMSTFSLTPIVSGCGTGTVRATQNTDGTWTFTAMPAEDSWFVRWGGLTTGEATTPAITLACDNSEAPAAIFGTSIKTVEELKAVWSDPDIIGYYRLEADLDLKGDGVRMTKDFGGLFDGNGHTISNLVLKLPSTDDVGLFAFLRNATVKNLAIRGGYIEGRDRVGGLVGRVKGGTVIENCTTDLEVVANGFEGGGFVGVIDSTGSCRLTRCRALGPVTGYYYDERVGGLIGRSDYAIMIDSCYASGAVTGYGTLARVGGLIGWRTGGTATIRNSYSISRLQGNYRTQATESTEDDIVGNWGDGGVTVVSTATIIDDVPKGIHLATRGNGSGTVAWDGAKPVATPNEGSVFIRWDGEMPTGENYNERTLYAVFGKAIATEADLRAVAAKGFYKQIDDIEMTSNMAAGMHNNPRFQGEYDGDSYVIKNLTLEGGNNDNVALFRATQGAILRNIILEGGKVAGRHQVAPLVGWMYGGLIERCSANMEVAGTGNHAAGLVGRSEGYATVRQSRALGSVTGSQYVGGLISYMSGTAYTYDCYSRCSVTASANAGGFIGATYDDNSVVHNCFVVGPVTGTGSGVGGFWGTHQHRTKLWDLIWNKEVSGQTYSYHGSALSTAEMKEMKHYAAWDDEVWRKVEGEYLELWAFSGQEDAPRFTVTWQNYDGTVLAQKEVREGVVPRYTGVMPIKPAVNGKFYNFIGWSPELTAVTSNVTYTARFQTAKNRNWMIVDLVTGDISYAAYDGATATNVFNTLEYKTKKMVFRRVAAGNDYYVKDGECTAQMASSYYIGLFEVTSAQYALMQSGSAPSSYTVADYRAQGSLNRSAVRGSTDSPETFGAGITETSPLGRFNARVRTANGNAALTFDLPTEAMWEVAARAADSGDTTRKTWKWYFGEDGTLLSQHAFIANDSSADDYGITSGLRVPGSRFANGWGLFDMYGNARELCLDGADGEDSPKYTQGHYTQTPYYRNGLQRTRGGSFSDEATRGRSSWRTYHDTGAYGHCGIRLARLCSADEEMVPEEEIKVPAETTGGTEVAIPTTWFETFPAFAEKFGDDFAEAAVKPTGKTTANGTPMSVWHDFVAGTDPTDKDDVFKAIIEVVDGVPNIKWEPNLNADGDNVRVYRKLGKAKLSDSEWLPADSGHNFFMVTVEMPTGAATSDVPGRVAPSGAPQ